MALRSPYFFWGGLCVVIVFSYTYLADDYFLTKQNLVVTILGGMVLLAASYTVWKLGVVVDIFADAVVEKRLFGLAGRRTFLLVDLRAIDLNPQYSNKLPKFVLEFSTGRVSIYEFQQGFQDAKRFFEDAYPQLWVT